MQLVHNAKYFLHRYLKLFLRPHTNMDMLAYLFVMLLD